MRESLSTPVQPNDSFIYIHSILFNIVPKTDVKKLLLLSKSDRKYFLIFLIAYLLCYFKNGKEHEIENLICSRILTEYWIVRNPNWNSLGLHQRLLLFSFQLPNVPTIRNDMLERGVGEKQKGQLQCFIDLILLLPKLKHIWMWLSSWYGYVFFHSTHLIYLFY